MRTGYLSEKGEECNHQFSHHCNRTLVKKQLKERQLAGVTVQESQEPREAWCWAQLLSMMMEGFPLRPR